jgi:hypothetical protein
VRGVHHFWLVGEAALAVGALSAAVYTGNGCARQDWTSRIASASKDYDVLDELASRAARCHCVKSGWYFGQ